VGHGVDQMLAVVDQQQALPAAELVDEYVRLVAAALAAAWLRLIA